jgi:outer membrane protein
MKSLWLALTFTLLCSGWTYAQTTDASRVLSLEEAIELALDNSTRLKEIDNNVSLAKARRSNAAAAFLPNLNGNVSQSRNIGRQFDNTTGDFGDFTINSFGASLNSSMPLFTGFANINEFRSSDATLESREFTRQRVKEQVIFSTASAYLQYLLSLELRDLAQQTLDVSKQQLTRIQAQVEVGARPEVDLLNQESTVASNEFQLINRQNAVVQNRLALLQEMELDPQEDISFDQPDIDELNLTMQSYDLDQLISVALENRADYQSQQASIQAAYFSYKATQGRVLPSLSLSANIRSSLNDRNPFSYADQFTDQNISRGFSLSLNIPFFNRLSTRTAIVSQKLTYENTKLGVDRTRLNIISEVTQAYNDYQARVAELESTEKALAASERAYETELERYDIGISTLVELNQSQALFEQAQSNRLQAIYSYTFQEKLLDYYIGNLNETLSLN